jgi:hypothetical protein
MPEVTIDSGDIFIRGEAEDHRDLHARALEFLILEAPVHAWEKESIEYGGDGGALEHFCSDVLAALAFSWRCDADLNKPDDDPTRDAPRTLGSVLEEIIGCLREAKMLDRMIPAAEGDVDPAEFGKYVDDDPDDDDEYDPGDDGQPAEPR